ncbi:MAG TPA: SRPBCC domain-containing protein [Phycisphaerales bacterium]|nr:SRPBCC domain-containing protein [Phycisphaerales bacterium]
MRGIRKERFYPYPPQDVWVAITDPRAIAEWLMPNTFKAEVGHKFRFMTDPMPFCEGHTECEVTECDPPRRLAYTWLIAWPEKPGKRAMKQPLPMVVSWTLTAENGGTRLVFEQTPYIGPRAIFTFISMNMGWGWMHKKLLPRVLARVKNGVFEPGAIPPEKRTYKAKTIPPEFVK